MAVIQPFIEPIADTCPDIILTDGTIYSDDTQVTWNFQFHDYSGGNPAVNETYTYTELNIGLDNLITSLIINTDGAASVIDPEIQYNAIIEQINLNAEYQAILVQPPLSNFKQWFVQIGSFDLTKAGDALSVVVAPGTITPLLTQTSAGAQVDVRNMVLFDPDGTIIPFGAIAQIDNITFPASVYPAGETMTLDFCDAQLQFTPELDTDGSCIAKEFETLINTVSANKFFQFISAAATGNQLQMTAKIPGVPLQVVPSYTLSDQTYFTLANATANTPNMVLPSFTSENSLTYTPVEKGGTYEAQLYLISGCDYNQYNRVFLNWCFDLVNFSCCFLNLVNSSTCRDATKNKCDSSIVLSILSAVPLMIESNFSDSDIQKVVDLGWSICDPLDCVACISCGQNSCNCNNNSSARDRAGGNCGCT